MRGSFILCLPISSAPELFLSCSVMQLGLFLNQRLKSLRSVLFRKFEDFGTSWSFEGTRNKFSVNFNVRRCRATMDTPLRSYEQTLMVMGSNLAPG